MKTVFCLLLFCHFGIILAQSSSTEMKYYITVPNSGRMGATSLPDSIDDNHYYTVREIKEMAEPVNGWEHFYEGLNKLEYPAEAKKKEQQAFFAVRYQINERGEADSVYVSSVKEANCFEKCSSCEALVIEYFKNTEWKSGSVRDTAVKTVDYYYVEFTFSGPKSKPCSHLPFSWE